MTSVKCEAKAATLKGSRTIVKNCSSKATMLVEDRTGVRFFACKKHSDGGRIIRRFPPGSTLEQAGPR